MSGNELPRTLLSLPLVTAAILCCLPQAQAVTLSGNIVNWWTFDSPGDLGAPQVGTVNLAPTNSPGSVAGVGGNSPFALDASGGGHLLAGAESSLDLLGSFTYSLWVRNTGGGQFLKMFQHQTGPTSFAQVETDNDNPAGIIWNVRIPDNPSNSEINTNQFLDGTWHHLALWRSGSTVGAFVDGVDIGLGSFGEVQNLGVAEMLTGTTGFAIGAQVDGGAPFPGYIDDFRVYDVALTQQNAAAIYNGGMGDFIPEPSAFILSAFGLLSIGILRRSRPM